MSGAEPSQERESRRLDQWLWFARVVKSRTQAARLCLLGEVAVNGAAVTRPRHPVRSGDTIVLSHRAAARKLKVLALGARRGPAAEARRLYEEMAAPVPPVAAWVPLLAGDEASENPETTTIPLLRAGRR